MEESCTIFLVDESRFFLAMEGQFLRDTQAEIVEARSAEEALGKARRQKPSLVYMDLNLTGESGAKCCRRFKADPLLGSVPIILLCEETSPEQLDLCRRSGCDGVLTKPLDRRRFLDLGRSLMAGIRDQRLACDLQVSFRYGGGLCTGRALDISRGGIFLECRQRLEPGMVLKLDIRVPRNEGQEEWIFCSGTVIWVNTRENPFRPQHPEGYGVKFTVLTDRACKALDALLRDTEGAS